jgi:hypothetical protein
MQKQIQDKAAEWFADSTRALIANELDEAIRCISKAIFLTPNEGMYKCMLFST